MAEIQRHLMVTGLGSGRAEIGNQFFLLLAYPLSLSRYNLLCCWFCVVFLRVLFIPLREKIKMQIVDTA